MYIALHHLAELCSEEKYKVIHSDIHYGLTGWTTLKTAPTPYNVHLIYLVTEEEDLSAYPLLPGMHLLILTASDADLDKAAEKLPSGINALILSAEDHHPYLIRMQEYFDHTLATGLFSQSLLEILSFEGGIQEMVNHAFQILENPIFVFDSSFKLIAANWDEAERHGIGTELIQNEGFSQFEFSLANKDHIHERIKKNNMPLTMHHKELGFDQMIVAIDTMRDLGHIVVDAVNRPFNSMDKNSLWVLKENIDQQMKKDEFIRNSKGFAYENFLKDLLDEKIAVNKAFMNRMQYVGVAFTGNMYCIVVEIARSSCMINPYRIRNEFEGHFSNCKTLIYNGQIVVLLTTPKNKLLTKEQIQTAEDICLKNNLYAGMSNCFIDIIYFAEYYKQALRAIELGVTSSTQPGLFLYKNFFLEHIKNIFLQKESSRTFCHPKIKFLLDYDSTHKSNLAYTLYMYLFYERNIGAAADAMNMHRSSLTYRLKKIYSLIGDDFEDARERQYMILSYELSKS